MRSEIISHGDRLYHLGVAPGEVAERIFLVGDPARASLVANRFDHIESEVGRREYVTITGTRAGVRLTVVGTGIGTDNVEIALIELDAALRTDLESGHRRADAPSIDLIRIGTSGGVQADIEEGTLCIAEYALGFDSTGPYYDVPAADSTVTAIEAEAARLLGSAIPGTSRFAGRLPVYASRAGPDVVAALQEAAEAAGAAHVTGITASSPGFFGPSSRSIEGLRNTIPDIKGTLADLDVDGRRVVNMEMESSLLFHLAGALGHRAGTICAVIGRPGHPDAVVDYDAAVETAIDVAIEAMLGGLSRSMATATP